MSEYWKSTPSYWCKFCSIYVRDTGIERKNHEASAKHQNNIQRSLRELHRGQERSEREKQRAKDEVARLNGLVSAKNGASTRSISGSTLPTAPAQSMASKFTSAKQRKAHAEQLAALGVELPDELKKEVTGTGNWQVVSEHVVETEQNNTGLSLADIKREMEESKDDVKPAVDALSKGVHKRKADDNDYDGMHNEETAPKRAAWGSNFKNFPGANKGDGDDDAAFEALLSGVAKNNNPEDNAEIKKESGANVDDSSPSTAAANDHPSVGPGGESSAIPVVVFKKRKGKK